jgi:hypothetical protein
LLLLVQWRPSNSEVDFEMLLWSLAMAVFLLILVSCFLVNVVEMGQTYATALHAFWVIVDAECPLLALAVTRECDISLNEARKAT